MSALQVFILLLIAGICGSVAQSMVGFTRGGCLASIALGFIGALLGMYLARVSGLPEILAISIGGQTFPVIWSIIGAALFCAVLAMMTRTPHRP